MRRPSSKIQPRHARRYVLGVLLVGSLLLLAAWRAGHLGPLLPWFCIGAATTLNMVWFAGFMGIFTKNPLDEAWLDGDELLLRRGYQTLRTPLANVASVDADRSSNCVILTLRTPSILGEDIRFLARVGAARDACAELRRHLRMPSSEPA